MCLFFIQISLKFVAKGPTDIKSALVQVMTWRQTGAKPLPEPMLTRMYCITRPQSANPLCVHVYGSGHEGAAVI